MLPEGEPVQEGLAALIAAGAASGNIFFDETGDTELRRTLDALQVGDTLLVLRITDICRDIAGMFDLLRLMHDRRICFRSLSEPWFNISPANMRGRLLSELIERLYKLACHMGCVRGKKKIKGSRPAGRPKGTNREMQIKLDTAFGMYNSEQGLSVTDICNAVGLNERTFYRHLSNLKQSKADTVRRAKGRKPETY